MAITGIYFIDTSTFETATKIWANSSRSILAPDGYYSLNNIYRQQLNGVLLSAIDCPTPTPTPTPTPSPTFTPTPTPTLDCSFDVELGIVTPTPTPTPSPTPSPTPTLDCSFDVELGIITPTPTPTPSPTPSPTATPTQTPTPTPTLDCSFDVELGIVTPTPTPTPSPTPSPTPTATPTPTPTPTVDCSFGVDLTLNYPPTDITLSNRSINENSSVNTIIGSLSATDRDSGETFTFSIVSGSSNFNISGTSLRSSQSFNYESATSYNVTIRVTDSVGQYFDKAFTIDVNNVNEAPYGLTLNNNSQQENTATGTTIGTFSSLDVDAGDTFTYSLYDTANYPDNNSFTVSSAGVLKNSAIFNYEAKTSYTIRVRTTDAGGLTYDGTFTINVTNQNEAPTNISLSSSSISENVPTGTTIGTLSSTDPDAGDTFTYALVDGGSYPDNSSFSINGSTLRSASVYNYENKSSYSIRVRTTDAGGLTYDKTLTITITNVTISVTASATTNVTCNGGTNGEITVSNVVGGTANYTYSKDGVNYQSSTIFSSLTAGSYTIYAKDSYGEVGSTSVTVTEPTIVSSTLSVINPTCFGSTDGSITVSSASGGSGSYTYSKDGVNYQAGTTFSNLGSGTYTIYVKDSVGCVRTNTTGLSRTQVTATVSQNSTTCNGGSDGSIVISGLSGGQGGPYSTKLNSGGTYQVVSTSRTYSSLPAGTYTIYVKDPVGCENTYSVTVTQPAAVTVGTSSVSYTTCYNGSNGSVTLNASGGNGSYQYRINSGSWTTNATFSSLTASSFTFQARDTAGCESSTITVDMTKSAPSATISQTNVSCNGGSDGSITVSNPLCGNSGVYTVSIDAFNYYSLPKTFSSLASDSYTVYIKDSQGCVAGYGVGISQPTAQIASITNTVNPTCANTSGGSLDVTSSGGVFPKTYRLYEDESAPYTTCGGTLVETWTNVTSGSPSRSKTGLTGGGFCLEVTDANGCITNSGITILSDPAVLYRYQIIRCADNAYLTMTSPDELVSAFLGGTKAVKIDNVCYQIDYLFDTVCEQGSIHLTDGNNSGIYMSCVNCTEGGPGAQV